MWIALLACSSAPPAPEPVATDRLAETQAAVATLAGTVRGRLQAAMAEGGPVAAVSVCADEAQALTAQVSRDTGGRVGRSSLRLRNPANAPPDWVAAWLAEQGERPAAGVEGFARVEDGKTRVLKPVAVEAVCVTCHGPPDQIPADVKALLAERYPADAATGYAVGDLRGAAWAEIP
jgi:Protein of unknown function (DUF3365)